MHFGNRIKRSRVIRGRSQIFDRVKAKPRYKSTALSGGYLYLKNRKIDWYLIRHNQSWYHTFKFALIDIVRFNAPNFDTLVPTEIIEIQDFHWFI